LEQLVNHTMLLITNADQPPYLKRSSAEVCSSNMGHKDTAQARIKIYQVYKDSIVMKLLIVW